VGKATHNTKAKACAFKTAKDTYFLQLKPSQCITKVLLLKLLLHPRGWSTHRMLMPEFSAIEAS
jgi:hypothetical protein